MNNNYSFNYIPNHSYPRAVPMMPNYITPPSRINSLFGRNTSKITFSGILNGTSKTLGVINQAIPVFYQIKPIWNNARTMIKVAKSLKEPNIKEKQINKISQKKEQENAPKFFI